MISWSDVAYGVALDGVASAAAVRFVVRERKPMAVVSAGVAALVGALAWSGILHDTGGHGFFHDAPISVFPVSWEDTGSGVFATATSALVLGFGALRAAPAERLVRAALACGIATLLVDIYLY